MDALIFMCIAIVMTIKVLHESDDEVSTANTDGCAELNQEAQKERVAKLNESFYEDTNAFSEIINALGFPKKGT